MATTFCSSSSWRPGRSRADADAFSPIRFWFCPTTTTATSEPAASSTALANSASSSKSSGTVGSPWSMWSNSDGNSRVNGRTPGA